MADGVKVPYLTPPPSPEAGSAEFPYPTLPQLSQVGCSEAILGSWHIPAPAPRTPLSPHSDATLVMEMLRRGYAVMKLPKNGGLPETLREKD